MSQNSTRDKAERLASDIKGYTVVLYVLPIVAIILMLIPYGSGIGLLFLVGMIPAYFMRRSFQRELEQLRGK